MLKREMSSTEGCFWVQLGMGGCWVAEKSPSSDPIRAESPKKPEKWPEIRSSSKNKLFYGHLAYAALYLWYDRKSTDKYRQ